MRPHLPWISASKLTTLIALAALLCAVPLLTLKAQEAQKAKETQEAPEAAAAPERLTAADVSAVASGELRVAFTAWSNYEGGPPMPAPVSYLPGEQVVFRAKLAGFRVTEVEYQRFRLFLSYEISAEDFRGIPIGDPKQGNIEEPMHSEDKTWLPTLDYTVILPGMAEFGDYRITLKVRDQISQRERTFVETFRVNGKRLPDLESVSVINFGYYRRQEDRSALPAGVYRPGNMLWAKFDVAGFQLEAENHFHVQCDIQIRDASGKVLFEQPQALVSEESPKYPQRYVPGVFSLEIKPGTPKNEYSVVVIARDVLSGRQREHVFPFSVE